MKMIFKIAKTELQSLFYSPVAWLILVIFTFQVGMIASALFEETVRYQAMGYTGGGKTFLFGKIFTVVQSYLYLYIPLLTMGVVSRDLGGGTIKLLHSSPLRNSQIILGKYLGVMVFGLAMMGVLVFYTVLGLCTIHLMDLPYVLSGLLGLFLLLGAYAAIGVFMSSITSYQVVAALGTLGVLSVLNYVGMVWQDMEFIRDLTYWLSIRGRTEEFIRGLICSEDVIYFLVVIALFLTWATLHIRYRVQRSRWSVRWGAYVGALVFVMLVGYLSSRPKLMSYYDATRTKRNSLSVASQDIVARAEGGLTITTYTNILDKDFWSTLPGRINSDKREFREFVRFKPEMKLKYVYFYADANNEELDQRFPDLNDKERAERLCDQLELNFSKFRSPEEMQDIEDLSEEGNRTVRVVERENGQKTFLRFYDFGGFRMGPGEAEISAAIKRLVMRLPHVGFLKGHGERSIYKEGDREYKRFSSDKSFMSALINQGFDVEEVTLEKEIPAEIDILVISELRSALTSAEKAYLDRYIERGGNLLILGEPTAQDRMNPVAESFGVQFMSGRLVRPSEVYQADLIQSIPTDAGVALWDGLAYMREREGCVAMPGSAGLTYTPDKGYSMTPILVSDTVGCWNEVGTKNFMEGTITYDSISGDRMGPFITAMALTRQVNDKEQRVVIVGDSDCISNGEFASGRKGVPAMNYTLVRSAFYWLSYEEVPVRITYPELIDDYLFVSEDGMEFLSVLFMGILPALLAMAGMIIWIRRKGR